MRPLILLLIGILSVAMTGVVSAETTTPTMTYTVNRSDDVSGLFCLDNPDGCTLRSAINLANAADPGFVTILIEDGLGQINLTAPLPALSHTNTSIINSVGNSRVIINGGGNIATGFEDAANGVYLFRLAMQGFTENYVNIDAANATNLRMDGMALEGNCASEEAADKTAVGLNVIGAPAPGNVPDVVNLTSSVICGMKYGIYVNGAAEVRVGYDIDDSTSGHPNIIFGNRYAIHGVDACSIYTYGNSFSGNVYSGVWLRDGRHNCFNRFDNDYVANNGNKGFVMSGTTGKAAITPREVHSNGGIGIDLGNDGWTSNDGSADLDSGPNDLYNAPELFVDSGDPSNIITIFAYESDGVEPFKIYLYEAIGIPSQAGSGGKLIDTLFIPAPDPFNWEVKIDTNDYPELTTGYITAVAFRLGDFVTSEMSSRQSVPLTPTAVSMQQATTSVSLMPLIVLTIAGGLIGLSWCFGRKHSGCPVGSL